MDLSGCLSVQIQHISNNLLYKYIGYFLVWLQPKNEICSPLYCQIFSINYFWSRNILLLLYSLRLKILDNFKTFARKIQCKPNQLYGYCSYKIKTEMALDIKIYTQKTMKFIRQFITVPPPQKVNRKLYFRIESLQQIVGLVYRKFCKTDLQNPILCGINKSGRVVEGNWEMIRNSHF